MQFSYLKEVHIDDDIFDDYVADYKAGRIGKYTLLERIRDCLLEEEGSDYYAQYIGLQLEKQIIAEVNKVMDEGDNE